MKNEQPDGSFSWIAIAERLLQQSSMKPRRSHAIINEFIQLSIFSKDRNANLIICNAIIRQLKFIYFKTISMILDKMISDNVPIGYDECYYTFVTIRRDKSIAFAGSHQSRNCCIDRLVSLLSSQDEQQQLISIEGLGICAPLSRDVLARLMRLLYEHSGRVVSSTLDALCSIDKSIMVDCCVARLFGEDVLVRRTAARLLRATPIPSDTVIHSLTQALNDIDDGVKFFAAESLTSLFPNMPPPRLTIIRDTFTQLTSSLRDLELQQRASAHLRHLQSYG